MILPFERRDGPATSADPYFYPRPELDPLKPVLGLVLDSSPPTKLNLIEYILLLFHVNHITVVCCLCISPAMVKDVIEIVHEQEHLGFVKYYEIVFKSWYIGGLTKLLHSYIHHYLEC